MPRLLQHLEDENEKAELLYDMDASIKQIQDWRRHLLRDAQQNKAKTFAMDSLDECTGLWLSDWSQKILPVMYREGQKDYFGKKGMSMHIDVILTKTCSMDIHKAVYLTIIQRSEQDVADTLCVEDNVLYEIKKDHPKLSYLYR